ncbi:hypothetical protein KI387_040816, partial [Taxus chinensis]
RSHAQRVQQVGGRGWRVGRGERPGREHGRSAEGVGMGAVAGVWRTARVGEGYAQGAGGGRGADGLGPGQRPSSSRGTVGW